MRTDDIERAIWLLDDLGLFFGSLTEQERNQYAQKNWANAQSNYETASGRLAERFGRGLIRIADLDDGAQFLVQNKMISLDRDLDGAWPAARMAALRERGEDDWSQLSLLSGVLLRALAPSYDLESWAWFQDHLRRTPSIAKQTEAPGGPEVAGIAGFGFLRDRYLLSAILAETAPRTALRALWADRRDSLDGEAKAFFQRQVAGTDAQSPAGMERQWAEFTKSSLQLSQSWADKRTEPAVPSFGRVSDVDLLLLVQRAARQLDPLAKYALALPARPLRPAAVTTPASAATRSPTISAGGVEAGGANPAAPDGGLADSSPSGIVESAPTEGQSNSGGAQAIAVTPGTAAPASELTEEIAAEPETAARFPLPELSGLDEKLERGQAPLQTPTVATLSIPDSPAAPVPATAAAVEPSIPASQAEPSVALLSERGDQASPGEIAADADIAPAAGEPAVASPGDPTEETRMAEAGASAPESNRDIAAETTARSPADTQVTIVPDRGLAQGSHLSVWIEGIGAEGIATLGLAVLSFLALSLLMALWLRALFRSERTAERGEQQIIVVVETERDRQDSSNLATAGAVAQPGGSGNIHFIPAPPHEHDTYAAPPPLEPDAWPSSAASPPARQESRDSAPPQFDSTRPDLEVQGEPASETVAIPPAADGNQSGPPDLSGPVAESPQDTAPSQVWESTDLHGDVERETEPTPSPPPVTKDIASDPSGEQRACEETADAVWPFIPAQKLSGAPSPTDEADLDRVEAGSDDPVPIDPGAIDRDWPTAVPVAAKADVRREPEPLGAKPEDDEVPDAAWASPRAEGRPDEEGAQDAAIQSETENRRPIVEPNQIEQALVALRDGQDDTAPADISLSSSPQPFATVVTPATIAPEEADERLQDDTAHNRSAEDPASVPAEPDPFVPRLEIDAIPQAPLEGPARALDVEAGMLNNETDSIDPAPEDHAATAADGPEESPLLETADADPDADQARAVTISAPQPDSLFKEIGNALRAGDMVQVHAKFSNLTLLPPDRVERILYSPGGEDFAVTCRALGVDKLDFASLFLLVRKQCLGEDRVAPHRFSRVLALYDEVEADAAEQVLDRWRTDPNYPGILDRMQDGHFPLDR